MSKSATQSGQAKVYMQQGATTLTVDSGGTLESLSGATVSLAGTTSISNSAQVVHVIKSRLFNIDNGSGTTLDDTILIPPVAITLVTARVIYTTETTGTVAAATISVGTTVGGVDLVAATALENSKAVGTSTALTLAATAVSAGTPIIARHTGVATTATGEYYVQIRYTIN